MNSRTLKKITAKSLAALALMSALLLATPVAAAPCPDVVPDSFANVLRRVACGAGYTAGDATPVTQTTIITIIGNIVNIVLGMTGIVFVGFMIYGGFLWMTARGNEQQVQESEHLIRNCVIGVVIVFAAFSITRFVIDHLSDAIAGPAAS